jgi:hypothetical protein
MSSAPFRHAARKTLSALLLVVMLLAQAIGLQHRIEHAGGAQVVAAAVDESLAESSGEDGDSAFTAYRDGKTSGSHSCVLADAAALADALHGALDLALSRPGPVAAIGSPACVEWDAPLARYFSSRAPPGG